jgi:sortase A
VRLERILLSIGLLSLGLWAASFIVPALWQDWENWVFDSELRRQPARFGEYAAARLHGFAARLGLKDRAPEEVPAKESVTAPGYVPLNKENGVMGRLNIPRLQLRGIVREGASEVTLSLGLGHIPGTAFPGQTGSVGVAGHRDKLFRGLRRIQKDDQIQLETTAQNYTYSVVSTQIVLPNNVGVLKPAAEQGSELTLVTCYPFDYIGAAPYRFIVKARQVRAADSEEILNAAAPIAPPLSKIPVSDSSSTRSGTKGFNIALDHSLQLASGISFGLTQTDVKNGRFSGWVWLMPDRRTVWLRNQKVKEAVVFARAGVNHELLFTQVTGNSIAGYLIGNAAQ